MSRHEGCLKLSSFSLPKQDKKKIKLTKKKPNFQVPEGHCWIVGDNLPASRDSRSFGPLPLALVQGKVVAKILPWKERMWFTSGLQPLNQ